jgi:uncharacterized damage-inducible protein DinB
MNVDGETLVYSPADIFAHTLLHERQHHGDVHTLLHQLGIEVPIVEPVLAARTPGVRVTRSQDDLAQARRRS